MATAYGPKAVPETLIRKTGSPRESEIALRTAARDAGAPAFARIWSSPEDDVYTGWSFAVSAHSRPPTGRP